ncbi:MAG TPA: GFA family protein, partial [Myxococcota bacterium]|nr:GFA family protein [Myxococcota bacterium]
RYFCPRCGAPVYGRHPTPPQDQSDLVCICIPSLDRPDEVRPTAHIWCGSGLTYFDTRDDLPRFSDGRLSPPSQRPSWRAR